MCTYVINDVLLLYSTVSETALPSFPHILVARTVTLNIVFGFLLIIKVVVPAFTCIVKSVSEFDVKLTI